MKRDRLLILVIIILVAINLLALSFFLMHKPGPKERKVMEFDRMIIKELDLNDDQKIRFDELKDEHHKQMMEIERNMKKPYDEYFSLLLTDQPDIAIKDSLELVITRLYQQKVNHTYEHFDKLKAICNKEQIKKFDSIIPHFLRVISPAPIKK